MKYTKYQYKKKSNGIKFLSSLVMTTVLAISIGVFVAWILLKVIPYDNILGKINDATPIEENNDEQTMGETLVKNISVIQCGYFSKEDNNFKHLKTNLLGLVFINCYFICFSFGNLFFRIFFFFWKFVIW